ncbi:MAG: hypothetical protein HRT47_05725 [Candidatus Caenarcaniphilales bacterium]|nr:hypothetical protein [Candidatus Caenarcaniphilales bacterium]
MQISSQIKNKHVFTSNPSKIVLSEGIVKSAPEIIAEISRAVYDNISKTLGQNGIFYKFNFNLDQNQLSILEKTRIVDQASLIFKSRKSLTNITDNESIIIPSLQFNDRKAFFTYLNNSLGQSNTVEGLCLNIPIDTTKYNLGNLNNDERNVMYLYVTVDGYKPNTSLLHNTKRHELVHAIDPNANLRVGNDNFITEVIALIGEHSSNFMDENSPISDFLKGYPFNRYIKDLEDKRFNELLDIPESTKIDRSLFNQKSFELINKLTNCAEFKNSEVTRMLMGCKTLDDFIECKNFLISESKENKSSFLSKTNILIDKLLINAHRVFANGGILELQSETSIRKTRESYNNSNWIKAALQILFERHLNSKINFAYSKLPQKQKNNDNEVNQRLLAKVESNLRELGGIQNSINLTENNQGKIVAKLGMVENLNSRNLKITESNYKLIEKAFEGVGIEMISPGLQNKLSKTSLNLLNSGKSLSEILKSKKNNKFNKQWLSDIQIIIKSIKLTKPPQAQASQQNT